MNLILYYSFLLYQAKKSKKVTFGIRAMIFRKKITKSLDFSICWIILLVFTVFSHLTSSGEPQVSALAFQEAKEAREAAEQRAGQLEAEVLRLRKDLDRVRSSYADLYLQSQSVIERLRLTEVRAAHLLRQKEGDDLGKLSLEAIEALSEASRNQLAVEESLRKFEESLATILDVLRPSDALRRELMGRLQDLRGSVESSLKPLSIVARRGDGVAGNQGCGVLGVDESLGMVLLDRGSQSGMRSGTTYVLRRGDELLAKVRVVEVRVSISAAVLVSGTMSSLAAGSVVVPE